jgi:predicted DsbA family dithiol-disulfide isomerase
LNPTHVVADMVDAGSFDRLSNRYRVSGVPMTVVNGKAQVTGAVPEAQLMRTVRQALGG